MMIGFGENAALKGHDLSRAAKHINSARASAPEGGFAQEMPVSREFLGKSLLRAPTTWQIARF
jgi:hypothetical protein